MASLPHPSIALPSSGIRGSTLLRRASLRSRSVGIATLALTAALIASAMPVPGGGVAVAASVTVPSSIDASGSADVTSQLQSLINRARDGSTIVLRSGATYRLTRHLSISGRRGLTIEGNRATLMLTGPGGLDGAGIIVEGRSKHVTVRNLNIVGNHSAAGTSHACCSREGQHAIAVYGSYNVLVRNVDIRRVGGDCFYVSRDARGWSRGVTFRDSTCRLVGRHGLTIEGGRNVNLIHNAFDQLGFMFVDIEPGTSSEGAIGVVIRGNRIGSYGVTGQFDPYFFAACDAPWGGGSTVRDVTVTGNTVGASRSGWRGEALGLQTIVCGDNATRANFTFTNNTARAAVQGHSWGVLQFKNVHGVRVAGNVQPHTGELATFPGSSKVTYRR